MIKDFKLLVKIVAVISNVCGILFLLGLLLSIIERDFTILLFSISIYIMGNLVNKIIWRCPYCKRTFPRGVYTHQMKICKKCKRNL